MPQWVATTALNSVRSALAMTGDPVVIVGPGLIPGQKKKNFCRPASDSVFTYHRLCKKVLPSAKVLPRIVKFGKSTPTSISADNSGLAVTVDVVSIHDQTKKSFCRESVGLAQAGVQALSFDIDPLRRRAPSCVNSD